MPDSIVLPADLEEVKGRLQSVLDAQGEDTIAPSHTARSSNAQP